MRPFPLAIIVFLSGLLISSALAQGEKATEPLTIVGPYYQLGTPSGAVYTISGAPGTYQVLGQAVANGTTSGVLITITIPPPGPPGPGPPPPPTPPPPAPPNGITGKMWVVFVADTNSAPYATPGSFQSQLWGSTTIGPALAVSPMSAQWRHYDAADPLVGTTNWGKAATKLGLPALIIVDDKGNASPYAMPLNEDGIVSVARKARGL